MKCAPEGRPALRLLSSIFDRLQVAVAVLEHRRAALCGALERRARAELARQGCRHNQNNCKVHGWRLQPCGAPSDTACRRRPSAAPALQSTRRPTHA